MSRAFWAGAASQAGDADSSRAPGLTSGLQGSVNVHRDALLLVPQWQCSSSFIFYIKLWPVIGDQFSTGSFSMRGGVVKKNGGSLFNVENRPSIQYLIITDSVVLWKIHKFDWLIPETKWYSCLHNRALCSNLATLRLLRQRENNPQYSGTY